MPFGACSGADPDIFFQIDENQEEGVFIYPRLEEARAICATCDFREACLDSAIGNKEYGIWAGTTEDERLTIISTRYRLRKESTSAFVEAAELALDKIDLADNIYESRGEQWHDRILDLLEEDSEYE